MAGRRRLMFAKDFTVDYLKFTALESGTITLTIGSSVTTSLLSYVEYSVDDGANWVHTNNVASTTVTVTTPTLSTGDEVLWRGSGTRMGTTNTTNTSANYSAFSSTCQCNVSGDINTLLGLSHPNNVSMATYIYKYLFKDMAKLVDASGLILPSITSDYCYYWMFANCTSLISAPQLPATTAANYCYQQMFDTCKALTSAPSLPATTLGYSSYKSMFTGCKALTSAPSISAISLQDSCCYLMFYNCTSLSTSPSTLPATTLATNCYYGMFSSCTSLTTVPTLPATILADSCYSNMFNGCSNITTAPVLPARVVGGASYQKMFYKCGKLNYIKAAFTDYNTINSLSEWVYQVASTGTFVKSPLAAWNVTGSSGVPTGWTVSIDTNAITEYNPTESFTPAGYITFSHSSTIYIGLARRCTYHTVYLSKNGTNWHELQDDDLLEISSNENCYICGSLTSNQSTTNYTQFAVNGSFSISGNCNALWDYTNLSTTLRNYCGYYLFKDCKGLTSVSGFTLPSLTLTQYCYYGMFYGCISLTSPPQLPATTLANYCYYSMFYGCTSLTSAPSLNAVTMMEACYSYMFYECTSLVSPPTLSSMSLASSCYGSMFYGCTSLSTAPQLPATTLTNSCYNSMFRNCKSLVTAPTLTSTAIATLCYNNMFNGCSSLINVQTELPATTLQSNCYNGMFNGCVLLQRAPDLPATTLVSKCYNDMFNNSSKVNYIKALFTTTPSSSYTSTWLRAVSSTGIFVKNINATWTTTGTSAVPTAWTIIYYDPSDEKYYTDQNKTTECDDHGNPI